MGTRRRAVIVVGALLLTLMPAVVAAAAEDPGRGLVYRDLRPGAADGPCRGLFEIVGSGRARGGRPSCTHGPDPVPAGDTREATQEAAMSEGAPVAPASAGFVCHGTGSDGFRVHVAYARASDVPDRFATTAPQIAKWVAAVDAMLTNSAAQTGGSQQVRWLTDPSCNLVVDNILLSRTGDDSLSATIRDLRDLGYSGSDRKYLTFVDSSVYCGIAEIEPDDRAVATPGLNRNNGDATIPGMVARVDNRCWGVVDGSMLAAHELLHTLGGVQQSAPHATPGWHCTDESDRMCYDDDRTGPVTMQQVCPATQEKRFDCNHDDYYSTAPSAGSYLATHWNTANSVFLTSVGPAPPSSPPNDAFAGAQALNGPAGSLSGATSLGATKEPGEPNHAGYVGGASVWFRWTAPAAGPVTVDTAGSGFDTMLAVYAGSTLTALSPVAANDDDTGLFPASKVTFLAEAGTTYAIAVDGLYGAGGEVRINWIGPTPGDPPPADLDGDGRTDVAVFRPASGSWLARSGAAQAWGTNGDIPVPADYDGDGDADVAVFRPPNGVWFVSGGATLAWGTGGDVPVPADYDGDDDADVAVFRPPSGLWFVSGGTTVAWGVADDIPVPADYDGDGDDDVAVFRPATGTWFVRGGPTVAWGTNGDIPVPADYDGDGDDDVAVFRPSNGIWFVRGGVSVAWGTNGDVPVPGDYDGDRTAEPAVYRRPTGTWFVSGATPTAWGVADDVALPLPTAIAGFFP